MTAYQQPVSPARGNVLAERIVNFRKSPPAPRADRYPSQFSAGRYAATFRPAVRHGFAQCRHKTGDGASQFWWQQRPQDGHRHSNKRALFPVHVLEYSDNSVEASIRTSVSPEAPHAAAAEYQTINKETSHLHSKGDAWHLLYTYSQLPRCMYTVQDFESQQHARHFVWSNGFG